MHVPLKSQIYIFRMLTIWQEMHWRRATGEQPEYTQTSILILSGSDLPS